LKFATEDTEAQRRLRDQGPSAFYQVLWCLCDLRGKKFSLPLKPELAGVREHLGAVV